MSWVPTSVGMTVLARFRFNLSQQFPSKTYPRPRTSRIILASRHADKGHELVPRALSGESMQGRPEKSVCRGFAACRATRIKGCDGAGKRPLEVRCADEWRGRRLMDRSSDPQLAERRGHQGRRRGRKLACRGAVMVASPNQLQRTRPRRPVPLLICLFAIGDSRSASRPPIALAVASAGKKQFKSPSVPDPH